MRNIIVFVGIAAVCMIAPCTSALAGSGIDGTGAVGTCPAVGSESNKPALSSFNITSPEKLSAKTKTPKGMTCSGGTGDGTHVISATSKGVDTLSNNDCFALLGTNPSSFQFTVKWKTDHTVSLNPSHIAITTETGDFSTTPPSHILLLLTGTVTSGSFSGHSATTTLVSDQDVDEVLNACDFKGLKKLTFGSKPSNDDGQIGSASVAIN